MKKQIRLAIFIAILSVISIHLSAQVSINNDNSQPDPSAILDVKSTTMGFLPPRVELTAINSAGPIASPAVGLLVYNTATAGMPPNNVAPGYYCWIGTKWVPVIAPQGANAGDMQYWNGTQWVSVPAGSYGQQLIFCNGIPVWGGCVPLVSTTAITGITPLCAKSGGNVTSDGGVPVTARGICWNTSPNPTTANSHTTDGSGTGVFASLLSGLTNNTMYYVRAYATNSVGTAYGNQLTFTTAFAAFSVRVLVVGGGGSGASGEYSSDGDAGGGGGAGGYMYMASYPIANQNPCLVIVGGGGGGNQNANDAWGNPGATSYFYGQIITLVGYGGGRGGKGYDGTINTGGSGGCGGGAGGSETMQQNGGTASQGQKGGDAGMNGWRSAAGGGGYIGAGSNNPAGNSGGNGGTGILNNISGADVYYCGGGGGGAQGNTGAGTGGSGGSSVGGNGGSSFTGSGIDNPTNRGQAGAANTGSGGGGGAAGALNGGNGGSGVVIVRYTSSCQRASGGTVTIVGGDYVHTFTSSGNFVPF